MKILIPLLILPPLVLLALFGTVLYEGPRMKVQHHIREFQMSLPDLPPGSHPVLALPRLPTTAQAARLRNPLPVDARNLMAARVYYTYYCVFCHGDSGAGDGPVGQSYQPRPADLRTGKVPGFRDGELLRAMLTGVGHAPVLERVVPPEHRWYLVLYLRSLAGA
jgi:hypothetical protein